MINNSSLKNLSLLWRHLQKTRKKQFWFLLLLMLVTSVAEVLSIGTILPFLTVLISPQSAFSSSFAAPYIQTLGISSTQNLLLAIALLFALATIVSGCLRYLLLVKITTFSYGVGTDFSTLIFRTTLYQPYEKHITRNSSVVVNGILSQTGIIINGAILPGLMLLIAILMFIAILIPLFSINALATGVAFGGFALIYLVIILITRKRLLKNGYTIASESSTAVKFLSEGLGGIRDILLNSSQEFYIKIFKNSDNNWRIAQANNNIIGASPRYGVEVLGMLLIIGLAYFLAQDTYGASKTIPLLGALALGAQRLLPVLQQAYGSWSSIVGAQAAIKDILNLLEGTPKLNIFPVTKEKLLFSDRINLSDLWFRYDPNLPWVLRGANLSVKKGDRIGFIGVTGSGKSTLLDLFMGFLPPTKGVIQIDKQILSAKNSASWQANIAHVPQTIFLSDASIAENIAFGVPAQEINLDRVKRSAEQAQISATIESMKFQYSTFVGERGVKLSGGQRQRIGIARALYKDASVLILDEATNALDLGTEQAVMDALEKLPPDLTIVVIAHRVSTLKSCNRIAKLVDGKIEFSEI